MHRLLPILFLAFISFPSTIEAQTTVTVGNTTLTENIVATGLSIPWEILWGPDDYIWVTERTGTVKRINPGNGNMNTILDLSASVYTGSEPGLLGMTLHPDFENTPKVFLVYTYYQGNDRREKLVTYDWNGTSLSNEEVILDNILAAGIHNGSRLLFLPDNTLLMTTGDVNNSTNSQSLTSKNGKTLRLNMDGTIPADNPDPSEYYYTFGNRNSQGLCIAPNGIIYSSEHGQNHSDELNIIEAGRNYGWPEVEGVCDQPWEETFCTNNNVLEPKFVWESSRSPNGLVYYDHAAIPEWENTLLVSILGGISAQKPRVSVLQLSEDGTEILSEEQYFKDYGRIRDVCINPHTGSIFFATNGPEYPSSGPNRIVEYRNEAYVVSSNEPILTTENQFIKVSPNPISNFGKVEFSENFIGYNYDIISYNGQVVETGKIENKSIEISKKMLPAGAYYIKATNDKGTITQTIIMAE